MDAMKDDPSSGDGAVPNWRARLTRKVRVAGGAAIAWRLFTSPDAKIHVRTAIATAARVEGGFYEEATSERDYLTRVNDYIQSIPRPPGIFQAARVDLNSQMGHLNISQEQPMAWLCSQAITIFPPQQQPQLQQPLAGSISDSNAIPPPQQQPQPQQSGPNVDQMEILEDLLALMDIGK